jgi:hypothetical protein
VKDHPDEGSAHFLLAYHYLVNGSKDKAVAQLKDVVRLEPKDQLSAALLKALRQPDTASAAGAPPGANAGMSKPHHRGECEMWPGSGMISVWRADCPVDRKDRMRVSVEHEKRVFYDGG